MTLITPTAQQSVEPGTAFIVPLGSPLPAPMMDFTISTGSLLQRILPLADDSEDAPTVVIPIDGADLFTLERAWHNLVTRRRVVALLGLPGALYDVTFDHAIRGLGIHTADWPSLEQWFSDSSRRAQQTAALRPDQTASKGFGESPSVLVRHGRPSLRVGAGASSAPPSLNQDDGGFDPDDEV